ncbi:UNVERIFIED_CONTAM: hypothetical protein B566_EDAN018926, partial [Ephemera danica]
MSVSLVVGFMIDVVLLVALLVMCVQLSPRDDQQGPGNSTQLTIGIAVCSIGIALTTALSSWSFKMKKSKSPKTQIYKQQTSQ